jgi:hypothetical protein
MWGLSLDQEDRSWFARFLFFASLVLILLGGLICWSAVLHHMTWSVIVNSIMIGLNLAALPINWQTWHNVSRETED